MTDSEHRRVVDDGAVAARGFRDDWRTWIAGTLFLGAAFYGGTLMAGSPEQRAAAPAADASQARPASTEELAAAAKTMPETAQPVAAAVKPGSVPPENAAPAAVPFKPPGDDKIPDDEFGKVIRLGQAIFSETRTNAPQFVGNDLQCRNCHIDAGRLANSAPLWGAWVSYPAFRSKNKEVNSFQARLQGCFQYSMNGKPPPLGDPVLLALESYSYFLAKGAPVDPGIAGRGYPKLEEPASFDRAAGAQIYAAKCTACHGADGEGQKDARGATAFPPLWGPRSYNWGAGMSSIHNAAAFIKANMPYSKGGTLTDAEAWNVAAFVDGHERPQDPRFTGDVAETRRQFHDDKMNLYGTTVDGVLLGQNSPPYGTVTGASN
jgi:thiosulfate dehydrogenase